MGRLSRFLEDFRDSVAGHSCGRPSVRRRALVSTAIDRCSSSIENTYLVGRRVQLGGNAPSASLPPAALGKSGCLHTRMVGQGSFPAALSSRWGTHLRDYIIPLVIQKVRDSTRVVPRTLILAKITNTQNRTRRVLGAPLCGRALRRFPRCSPFNLPFLVSALYALTRFGASNLVDEKDISAYLARG